MGTRIENPIILTPAELETVLDALSIARKYYGGKPSKQAAIREYSRRKLETVAQLGEDICRRRYTWI